MPELTFFHNARHDGGIRMGIELDGETTLIDDFLPGPPEFENDPLGSALLWYVDIRCRGKNLPSDPQGARRWFLAHRAEFEDGLHEFAEEIGAGTDDDSTLRRTVPFGGRLKVEGDDLQVEYACGVIRRVKGPELADRLHDVARHFGEYLQRIPERVPS